MLTLVMESAVRSLALGLVVWVALKAFRIRNPHTQAAAWTLVLVAALSMPLLMQWQSVPVPATTVIRFAPPVARITSVAPPMPVHSAAAIDWMQIAGRAYALIALLLLIRMATGLLLTWRLVQGGERVAEEWTRNSDVRSSAAISVPVTFGSTILVPAKWADWDEMRRRAVLAHERSHVEHGHFYVQLLAGVHRAMFWFNPLSWWLYKRLAALAEAVCDDAAINAVADRPSYAEILIDFARKADRVPVGVAMARSTMVSQRVERILSEKSVWQGTGWRAKLILLTVLTPLAGLIAGCSLQAQTQKDSAFHLHTISSDGEPFVIVHGGDTIIEDASRGESGQARRLRGKLGDDYVWFIHNSKAYYITDPAIVERAREFFRGQEVLGAKQAELGARQAELGKAQARLGELQAQVIVKGPDLGNRLEQLEAAVKAMRAASEKTAGRDLRHEELSELQARMGELQAQVSELQARASEKQAEAGVEQARLGELQGKLGEQQGQLGEEQGKLGEQQAKLAELASQQVRALLEAALRKGLAKPVE